MGGVKASMDKPFAHRSATVLDKEFHRGEKKHNETYSLAMQTDASGIYHLDAGKWRSKRIYYLTPPSLTQRYNAPESFP